MRYEFAEPSFKHQVTGVKALLEHDGVYALLWEPGTGKTKTVIDYLGVLACGSEQTVKCLVVCPKAVTDSWISQLSRFMGPKVTYAGWLAEGSINEKADFIARRGKDTWGEGTAAVSLVVVNLETFSSRRRVSKTNTKLHSDLLLDAVKTFAPHVLVVDESHRIKGNSSNAGRLLARIAKHVKRRILLTGTPMPHSPLDVWMQWQVLDPNAFSTNGKSWPFSRFREKYSYSGGYMGKEVKGFQYLDDLERRMGARSMPLRKEDCLDLPPVSHVDVPVRLQPAEQNAYSKLRKEMMLELQGGAVLSTPSMIVQRTRLRQITCGFAKPDNEPIQWIGSSRLDAAMSVLEDLLAGEQRVVVFAWARPEVDRLVERINASRELNGAVAAAITGDTSDAERLRLRQKFATVDDTRQVLVCQWRTVSLGINEFVAASHALFLSLSQQRDDIVQGMGRLDRQGQRRPVTFWWLQAPHTVDTIIQKAHQDRTNLEAALLDHIQGRF